MFQDWENEKDEQNLIIVFVSGMMLGAFIGFALTSAAVYYWRLTQ